MTVALFILFWLVIGFVFAVAVGSMIRIADERDRDPGTVFVTSLPPVPHPCTLPRRCPALHDDGVCILAAGHVGDHVPAGLGSAA